jgi:hypothetical protein
MEFLFKTAFFVMFGLTCLILLYLLMMTVNGAVDPYGKKSEVIIMFIAAAMLGVGLYFAYGSTKNSDQFLLACGILALTWFCALIVVLIGLFFFNGPIRWN